MLKYNVCHIIVGRRRSWRTPRKSTCLSFFLLRLTAAWIGRTKCVISWLGLADSAYPLARTTIPTSSRHHYQHTGEKLISRLISLKRCSNIYPYRTRLTNLVVPLRNILHGNPIATCRGFTIRTALPHWVLIHISCYVNGGSENRKINPSKYITILASWLLKMVSVHRSQSFDGKQTIILYLSYGNCRIFLVMAM